MSPSAKKQRPRRSPRNSSIPMTCSRSTGSHRTVRRRRCARSAVS
jgi:hypothetical protein